MGLACSQIRLLTLTARKADCEYGIAVDARQKQALASEQTQLTQEYQSKLRSKQISYYANNQYNKINYSYLMGYGMNYGAIWNSDKYALKSDNSMILSDYKGQVVMSDTYAKALTSVLGDSVMDSKGRGSTFSTEKIPEIIAALCPEISAEEVKSVINNESSISSSYNTKLINSLTGKSTGETGVVDNSDKVTAKIQQLVDFYYPIFSAAAANGWTTEYNKEMNLNDSYVSDALISGTFQLESVNNAGQYDEGTSLTYFITSGMVQSRTDSDAREEITAWYNAEKQIISDKESSIDLDMQDLSTELEAINTEIQSVKSLIDDAISSVFDWGSS